MTVVGNERLAGVSEINPVKYYCHQNTDIYAFKEPLASLLP